MISTHDFEVIADYFSANLNETNVRNMTPEATTAFDMIYGFCDAAKKLNPRFNREKFLLRVKAKWNA